MSEKSAISFGPLNGSALLRRLLPFLQWAPTITPASLKADAFAGLIGAIIVLPQGIAFAAIAGLPPEYGLYTAMVTPIVAALFGSSLHSVSGPTTAISIVVFSTVSNFAAPGSPEFIQIALTLTLLAGVFQLVAGVAGLGAIVNFISRNVIVGFTAGTAVLIAEGQLKNILGVDIPPGESFLHTLVAIQKTISDTNLYSVAVAAVTLAVMIAVSRAAPKLPNLLIGLIAGALFSYFIDGAGHGVAHLSALPGHLPPVSHPDVSLTMVKKLAPEALAVALLGLISTVSISQSIAMRSGQLINASQEFVGQGLSNIVGSFFSSYAGSGSFTRSGVNYDAGAKTPMSAIFAALLLMAIVIAVAPLMIYLPIPSIGAAILLVAYNLIDIRYIRKVIRISRREAAVLTVTFASTLFFELEFAIYFGMLLSLSLFLMRTSTPDIVAVAPTGNRSGKRRMGEVPAKALIECPQIKLIRIDMSIYFGSVGHIEGRLRKITDKEGYRHILVLGSGVNFIDMSGAEMLVREAARLRALGGGLYFCGIKPDVCEYLKKSGYAEEFGADNLFFKKSEAIAEVVERIDHRICAKCRARVFLECESLPNAFENEEAEAARSTATLAPAIELAGSPNAKGSGSCD